MVPQTYLALAGKKWTECKIQFYFIVLLFALFSYAMLWSQNIIPAYALFTS